MTDANETAWTAEGGKAIPNAVNESSEGTGFQPGDGVVEEASGPQDPRLCAFGEQALAG